MKENHRKTVLDNGITVLSLPMAGRAGVAVGVWLDVGSRDDPPGREGMAHLVEHLMFKGTEKRTSLQIARELEYVGGSGDAYTSREETCYYAYVPSRELPKALDIIGDMIAHSRIDEVSFQREKSIVLEEMAEVQDSPQEIAQEYFPSILFGNHPLGQSILGSPEGVKATKRNDVIDFMNANYTAEKTLVAAVGKIEHGELCELADKYINLPKGISTTSQPAPPLKPIGEIGLLKKPAAQVNIIIGGRLFPFKDELRYPFAILNKILGQGASSLLFQRVREEAGIGYDVHSFDEYFKDSGMWGVFGAFESKSVMSFLNILRSTMDEINDGLIDEQILRDTINGLSGNAVLQKDSISSMLNRLAENELQLGRFIPVEESINRLREVTPEQIRELASDLFNPISLGGIAVGTIHPKDSPNWLKWKDMA